MDGNDKTLLVNRDVVILGFGSLGPAMLSAIFKSYLITPKQITIVADDDKNKQFAEQYSVDFVVEHIERAKINTQLKRIFANKKNSVLINLSVTIGSGHLVDFCQENNILYIDSSFEIWADQLNTSDMPSVAGCYNTLQRCKSKSSKGSTAISCHGANPGMVSHFAKKLVHILAEKELGPNIPIPKTSLEWSFLAQQLDIHTFIISEIDTQCEIHTDVSSLYNTWSIQGFLQEAAEFPCFPFGTRAFSSDNQKYIKSVANMNYFEPNIASMLYHTLGYSPSYGIFEGMVIPHIEAFSMAKFFGHGLVNYAPTIYFCYRSCNGALNLAYDAMYNDWCEPEGAFVACDTLSKGIESLGILVLRHNKPAAWYGSEVSVREAKYLTNANATTMQVVGGLMSALCYALTYPDQGVLEPEDLDTHFVLDVAKPYMGNMFFSYAHDPARAKINPHLKHKLFDDFSAIKAPNEGIIVDV